MWLMKDQEAGRQNRLKKRLIRLRNIFGAFFQKIGDIRRQQNRLKEGIVKRKEGREIDEIKKKINSL